MTTPGPTNTNYIPLIEPFIDVCRDFSAIPDGLTDCSTAINNAITAAIARFGAGTILFPPGTYLCKSTITLASQVHLKGSGIEATIIKLANGVNADLMGANTNLINLSATSGAGSTGGIYNWSVQDMTLDGNKAGQSGGTSYCLRQYGFGFIIHNVRMRNGYSGGVLSDWNGGSGGTVDGMEAQVTNLKIHDCNGIGLQWGGPHDSQFSNVLVFGSGSTNFHIAPNATAMIFSNCHGFSPGAGVSACSFLIEGGYGQYSNCVSEGSDAVNTVILTGDVEWVGSHVFGIVGNAGLQKGGLQLGQQAGQTPFAGSLNQSVGVSTAVVASGCFIVGNFNMNNLWSVNFANETNNFVQVVAYNTAGSCMIGTPSVQTHFEVLQNGLIPDGTFAKGGGICRAVKSNQAWRLTDRTDDVVNVNTNTKRLELPNATLLRLYSDNYGNRTVEIGGGTVALLQSASAAVTANNGTITTAGVGVARVNPGADITGVILQAGTLAGQQCWVVNESSHSVTFAASGTSHVADGTSDAIAALTGRLFVWNGSVSLWYKAA